MTQEQLQAALQTQLAQEQEGGQRHLLGQLLVESGVLNEEQLRGHQCVAGPAYGRSGAAAC
ncbi:MAG: hypothetical protein U1E57_05110 [Paenacidovorax caeni]